MRDYSNKSVNDVFESMLESKLRRVQPGDEVGTMRQRKIAERQAGPMHQMLQAAHQALSELKE